jgi:hypothetical protein
MWVSCTVICFFGGHLVYFVVIWYIFSRFGTLYQEKSGSPAKDARKPTYLSVVVRLLETILSRLLQTIHVCTGITPIHNCNCQ